MCAHGELGAWDTWSLAFLGHHSKRTLDESERVGQYPGKPMKTVQPDTRHLRRELASAAEGIATRLAQAGHQTWLVGGAVRDLALGRRVQEIDLCTSATPDEIEAAFDVTVSVGRAFGTVIVVWQGLNVEVTTFRSERGYSDGRHPDEVIFGQSPAEDAGRRDFTINALFLDPLTQTLQDPTGGLEDLKAGILRAIGAPEQRFREDALRLMRLARFTARFDLLIDEPTEHAARAASTGIARVSPERIHKELSAMLSGPRSHAALRCLDRLGVLDAALPDLASLHGPDFTDLEAKERRFETLEWLESSHVPSGFAVLFDPLGGDPERAAALFKGLRPSNAELDEVVGIWCCLDRLEELWPLEESQVKKGPDRAARLRILAHPMWPHARDLAAAFGDARRSERPVLEGHQDLDESDEFEGGHLGRMGRELVTFAHGLSPDQIQPAALLTAKDLIAEGITPGPAMGKLLADLEEEQLQGHLTERHTAIAWVHARRDAE